MKKMCAVLFICVTFSMANIATAFGELLIRSKESEMYYSDINFYINGTPIQAYDDGRISYEIEEEEHYSYYYVLAEDLAHYGFDVIFDEESATLAIKRIPRKQPDILTFEKFNKLTANATNDRLPIDVYDTNIKVSFDGMPWRRSCGRYSKTGLFIPVDCLVDIYGSRTDVYRLRQFSSDSKKSYKALETAYVTIDYDYAVSRTPLSPFAYRHTTSLEDFLATKREDSELRARALPPYVRVANNTHHDPDYYATYCSVDLLVRWHKIQCSFTENALILSSNQTSQKEEMIKKSGEYGSPESFDVVIAGDDFSYACVDLKLISGGEEYKNESNSPIFISRDGELYMNLDILADALKE